MPVVQRAAGRVLSMSWLAGRGNALLALRQCVVPSAKPPLTFADACLDRDCRLALADSPNWTQEFTTAELGTGGFGAVCLTSDQMGWAWTT